MRREQPRARGTRSFQPAALLFAALSSFGLIAGGSSVGLAGERPRENALKAGYLFNFMKFVDWPASVSTKRLTVCFLGDSGVHEAFAHVLPEKWVAGREFVARRLSHGESFTGCQALYVDESELRHAVPPLLAPIPALLTVSDADDFLDNGGVIELFTEGDRLRFRISLRNARQANLRISSDLLQLAAEVEKES